jgi:hypothetical protein
MPHPRVLRALAAPTLGHLDPELLRLYHQEQELLRYVFQTENEWTFALSGTGTSHEMRFQSDRARQRLAGMSMVTRRATPRSPPRRRSDSLERRGRIFRWKRSNEPSKTL